MDSPMLLNEATAVDDSTQLEHGGASQEPESDQENAALSGEATDYSGQSAEGQADEEGDVTSAVARRMEVAQGVLVNGFDSVAVGLDNLKVQCFQAPLEKLIAETNDAAQLKAHQLAQLQDENRQLQHIIQTFLGNMENVAQEICHVSAPVPARAALGSDMETGEATLDQVAA